MQAPAACRVSECACADSFGIGKTKDGWWRGSGRNWTSVMMHPHSHAITDVSVNACWMQSVCTDVEESVSYFVGSNLFKSNCLNLFEIRMFQTSLNY